MGARMLDMTHPLYEALRALPDNQVGEIVDGELFASPRPASRHALASSVLGSELGGPFHRGRGGPGGWWILFEPELHLDEDVLVPDLAGWRRERLPQIPDAPFFPLAPDWVCEVLSPATARLDVTRKLPRYARAGVSHAWLVDPVHRLLEVFRLERERWVLAQAFSGEEDARAEPFEAIALELGALWLPETPAGGGPG
jgi:Uma2 family endonuclease